MAPDDVTTPAQLPRRVLVNEVWVVFAMTLGASGVYSLIHLIADATSGRSLVSQTATLNNSAAPGRPWIDLTYQLVGLTVNVVPVLLALYLLNRSGESRRAIGFDTQRLERDFLYGATLAAIVGGAGLGFYLIAHASGANLTVVAENLPDVWWRYPVLVLSAAQNGLLEEVLVAGYLLHRLQQLGWGRYSALVVSSTLRGSYHLYQGLGGFAGNFLMGLIFGWLYQRWGRVAPLVIAHTLMDTVAFVGYALLVGKVSWLPTP